MPSDASFSTNTWKPNTELTFPNYTVFFFFLSKLISLRQNELSSFVIMSSLAIFFFFFLSMHACRARRLGFVAEEIGNHVGFLAKDVNKLNPQAHELEMTPSISISNELQEQELQGVGLHGSRIQENLIGANTMKPTLPKSFIMAKEADAIANSGHEIIISSWVDLQGMKKVEVLKRVTRSMLGDSGGDDTEEAVDSKEKENVGDINVMDYTQPHRKPPIHNERN